MSILQTKLRIRFFGDASLRKRAKAVAVVTEKDRQVLDGMAEMMRSSGGIGLAAPQVGINKQMLVADVGQGLVVLVNPRITKKIGLHTLQEGCLSLPGIYVKVKRAKKVTVSALNERNEKISICAQDLLARVIQHEMDHLRGKLIIDYANFFQKIALKKELIKILKSQSEGLY